MGNWIFPSLLKTAPSRDVLRHINSWVAEEDKESRAALGDTGMEEDNRKNALEDLSSSTHVKNIGGENHYLLHRTMGDEEFLSHIKEGAVSIPPVRKFVNNNRAFTNFTSWSPNLPQIPRDHRNHMVSAWIPESHISFYPMAYKKHFEKEFPSSDANDFLKDEQESIIKPGKFAIAHSYSAPTRKNADGETIHNLTYQDIVNYEMDLRQKVSND